MKANRVKQILSALTLFHASLTYGAQETDPAGSITSRGPHHRVWSRSAVIDLGNGRSRTNTTSYTELGSGMHRWDAQGGQWVDSDNSIIILQDGSGAVSHYGAHQVAFAANLNTQGAITLDTPDGKRLRSHVLGLAWFDAANGRSEMFAQVQDSIGELHGTDTVIYPDAFAGVSAAVRYSNRQGGFAQDIILYERPSLPEVFAPETTRLEVWTEFIEAPAAELTQQARAGMTDDTLNFGAMQTGPGRAFLLGEEQRASGVPVAKRWLQVEGRTFLIEAVRYQSAQQALNTLPAQQAAVKPPALNNAVAGLAQANDPHFDRQFPSGPHVRAKNTTDKFRTAVSSPSPLRGERAGVRGEASNRKSEIANRKSPAAFVIDYDLVGSLTNFTFQCDTTYYASNTVNFYGTTTFEGGTVVKFAKTNIAQLNLNGTNVWATAQYRPAIFTAKDDHTVGDTIGSGTLSGYYGGVYLNLASAGGVENARISHASGGVGVDGFSLTNRHVQFIHCYKAVDDAGAGCSCYWVLENVLLYDIEYARDAYCYFIANHITVHDCNTFVGGLGGSGTVDNSIIADLNEWGSTEPAVNNCYQGSASGIFQTVGAAAHYLANGSVHRNAGNSSLNSTALNNDLKLRTTYPPIVVAGLGYYSNPLTFSPQAQRDTDTPDCGYHYDPLDFVISGTTLNNATFTILPGTAVGARGENGFALRLAENAQLICVGTPTNLNRIVRYNTVQEQANTAWTNRVPCIETLNGDNGQASIQCRFTEWSVPGRDVEHFHGAFSMSGQFAATHCQFAGGSMWSPHVTLTFSNCLFQGTYLILEDDFGSYEPGHSLRQCTMAGGGLEHLHYSADTWTLKNNLLALTNILNFSGEDLDADYNAYLTNAASLLNPGATHDVILATNNIHFQIGALGRFYFPTNGPATNLFNKGSTTADLVGLYHYTTVTNQVKETNSTVDLGFHYVTLNGTSLGSVPVDSDGDGWPDYWEDTDGNGTLGHRETKPNDATDPGLRVYITRPRSGSLIP